MTDDKCPVDHTTRANWLRQHSPTSHDQPDAARVLAAYAKPADRKGKGKQVLTPEELSRERQISSIPRLIDSAAPSVAVSDDACPASSTSVQASKVDGNWVYPSPSQFYEALQRKNRAPSRDDMPFVVPIHNAVNEKCWEDVLAWELGPGQSKKDDVKLVSFKGRPKDLSPRAWLKTLVGYSAPFDRHDWLVDRNGTRIRYVIDFYTGQGGSAPATVDQR
ncbi:uncharacterized protein L969DRAFT_92876 [Mixia osmundae IAM 14324]|uniref:Holocytochrome c-type synthase n=1 Tax=Mixia osmundae (strain CBS 9802 / IAM 14324 / JCM 22182 / KY 12970) TaxID=764103 RepID=G7DYU2_MIXOS|nr:uncharacterized protein L969DRAFT_92876 [Mixia osmundae IAM 14324]KEI41648.1 hypothetical protein L969DRAFT_92876 [Mixia osmundae IAM 14324]GAA95752.1 hypothetical protein E5Q_02409 [Mixia osmundae IAM 14324]